MVGKKIENPKKVGDAESYRVFEQGKNAEITSTSFEKMNEDICIIGNDFDVL